MKRTAKTAVVRIAERLEAEMYEHLKQLYDNEGISGSIRSSRPDGLEVANRILDKILDRKRAKK